MQSADLRFRVRPAGLLGKNSELNPSMSGSRVATNLSMKLQLTSYRHPNSVQRRCERTDGTEGKLGKFVGCTECTGCTALKVFFKSPFDLPVSGIPRFARPAATLRCPSRSRTCSAERNRYLKPGKLQACLMESLGIAYSISSEPRKLKSGHPDPCCTHSPSKYTHTTQRLTMQPSKSAHLGDEPHTIIEIAGPLMIALAMAVAPNKFINLEFLSHAWVKGLRCRLPVPQS